MDDIFLNGNTCESPPLNVWGEELLQSVRVTSAVQFEEEEYSDLMYSLCHDFSETGNEETSDFPNSKASSSDSSMFPSMHGKASLSGVDSCVSTPPKDFPQVTLVNYPLWKEFDQYGNEMIIANTGRCLFPTVQFHVTNLQNEATYSLFLDFALDSSQNRLRFRRGEWFQDNSFTDQNVLPYTLIQHELSPLPGLQWMDNIVSFARTKLTNRPLRHSSEGQRSNDYQWKLHSVDGSVLRSFTNVDLPPCHCPVQSYRRYVPRLHILKHGQCFDLDQVWSFTFPCAAFVSVTHYQNRLVNDLKKMYNPHAKGLIKDNLISSNSLRNCTKYQNCAQYFYAKSFSYQEWCKSLTVPVQLAAMRFPLYTSIWTSSERPILESRVRRRSSSDASQASRRHFASSPRVGRRRYSESGVKIGHLQRRDDE